ncbi:hypothetical protein Tco_0451347 [Tanacetum coccineum]
MKTKNAAIVEMEYVSIRLQGDPDLRLAGLIGSLLPNPFRLFMKTKNAAIVEMEYVSIRLKGDPAESTHEQTDDELTDQEAKQIEADDQAIQTILMGLPKDIYAAVDSCQTAKEIWLRVEQMMKGESIESYYHRFSKLMNDFSKEKHFPEKIASNLKFLNNLQSEWNRSVTNGLIIVLGITPPTANQNANQNGNGNVVAARAKGNANRNNGNQIRCYNCRGFSYYARNSTVRPRRRDAAYLQTHLLISQKEEQASTLGTQFDKAHIYDLDGSFENNSNVTSVDSSVEQSRGTVQQHLATVEETRAHYESLFNNLVVEVEKVNMVNCKLKERSTVSLLQKEKKKLKSDFQIHEDELLDKQSDLEKKIKELDNILVEQGQSIQTMRMLTTKPDSFYHTEQKMALEAAKFVQDFKSLAKEADDSLDKIKVLEIENECLLRAVASQDIMSIVQNTTVVETSDFQTKLERTKERFKNCIIKKENEYATLWNDWYKKYEECKYDKLSYDKAYNDMQHQIERLQAQLGDLKEFKIKNYAKENAHLKTAYKNLFDSIDVTWAQTKGITDSLQNKLHNIIYENTKLRARLSDKVSEQMNTTKGTRVNTQFLKQSLLGKSPSHSQPKLYFVTPFSKSMVSLKGDETNALLKPVTSNSAPSSRESTVVKNDKVIAQGMFRINPFKTSRGEHHVPNKPPRSSVRKKLIIVTQPSVIHNKTVNSNSNGSSSTGVDNTTKTRRPQPRSNTKNDRVPSASKSSGLKNKEVEVEEHHRTLLLSKNKKHMSSLFLGTIRFGNDHIAAILGYGNLQWGNILITMVYFVERLGHNLFSVGQFCDSDLEGRFPKEYLLCPKS